MNTDHIAVAGNRKQNGASPFVRSAFTAQSGQTLPFVAVALTCLLGMCGLVFDLGHAYVIRARLQNSANAAALAAAGYVYTSDSSSVNTTSMADEYSAGTGDENVYDGGTVSTQVSTKCLNMLMPPGSTCTTGSVPNAVVVTNSATVNTVFMGMFGVKTLKVGATATASMQGTPQPWNVVVIVDASGSMANTDSNCSGVSQFQCALNGVQTLLSTDNPCPPGVSSCSPSNASIRMALFSFPNIMTAPTNYLPIANACSTMSYSGIALPYNVNTLPPVGASSYTPVSYREWNGSYTWSASYEITYGASDADANGFVSDYYAPSSTSTGGLNASSSIVKAVGYGGNGSGSKVGCLPIAPANIALNGITGTATSTSKVNTAAVGEGITDYAPVFYAAQAALTAEANLHPGSKNAIVILGDGAMNTQWFYFPQGSIWQWPSTNTVAPSTLAPGSQGYDTLNTTPNLNALTASYLSSPTQEATGTISGVYPDFLDECQQSIVASQYAQSQGTTVYSVAYGAGSGNQSGCGSGGAHADDYNDVTLVAQGNNVAFTLSSLTPCVTMENIASSLDTFYSDYSQSGSGSNCYDNAHKVTALQDIFSAIATKFVAPRLLPNNAT